METGDDSITLGLQTDGEGLETIVALLLLSKVFSLEQKNTHTLYKQVYV